MKAEIKLRLTHREKKLEGLGQQRTNTAEQMAFLTTLATQFQRLVHFALNANHGADDVFDSDPALRLSPAVMQRMKVFSKDVYDYGHLYAFIRTGTMNSPPPMHVGGTAQEMLTTNALVSKPPAPVFGSPSLPAGPVVKPVTPAPSGTNTLSSSSDEEDSSTTSLPQGQLSTRRLDDVEELWDITYPKELLLAPKATNMKSWLSKVYHEHRGFEIGTFNASILPTLMKKQSVKWSDLSLGLVSDVIVMVHKFFMAGLASVCSDEDICRALVNALFDDLVSRYRLAVTNTKFLLEVESGMYSLTLNHYFNENLQKR